MTIPGLEKRQRQEDKVPPAKALATTMLELKRFFATQKHVVTNPVLGRMALYQMLENKVSLHRFSCSSF